MDVSDGSWIQSGYNTLDLSTQQRYRYAGVTRTVNYAYSDRDNLPLTATFYNGGGKVTNSYDDLTRLSQKSYRANGSDTGVTATYRYVDWTDTNNTNRTSGTVRGIIYGYDRSQLTISDLYYDYDGAGNVTAERAWGTNSKPLREQYTYDGKNQLIRHDSKTQDATFIYTYDNAGNIKSVKKYPYNDTTGTPEETRTFSYDDSSWKDLLTAYNGHAITHDGMGNMTSYNGSTYTWEGRRLETIQGGGNTYTYKYNADGIRTSKTINGTTTEYFLNGSQILAQKTGDSVMWFFYDSTGTRVAVLCGGVLYYYVYNLQGDVIALAGASTGRVLVKYRYDAWGNCTVTDDVTSTHVGTLNPFRYRGYYYDDETGLYYLNARYYSPEFGRFISPDNVGYLGVDGDLLSYNLYAYCLNNPVNRSDDGGNLSIGNWIKIGVGVLALGAAIALTVATGGGAAAVAVGVAKIVGSVALSTATSAGLGYLQNGKQGAIDGACNGFMFGSLSACGGAALKYAQVRAATTGSPNSMGQAGERMAGIDPKAKQSININGRTRIPDALTDTTLTEVKNVKYLSNTQQLKDFADFACATGRTLDLYVRPTTRIAQTVINAGWNIHYLW